MWQRYNQTTHIFEKSVDNGVIWTPLGLNASIITEGTIPAARLDANVAYKNIDNNFVAQTLGAQTRISGVSGILHLSSPAAIANGKNWRFINYDNGTVRFEILNDAGAAIIAAPLAVDNLGSLYAGLDLRAARDIYEKNRSVPKGHWSAVAFNAANYLGGGGINFSGLAASSQALNRYSMSGKTLFWQLNLNLFVLTGTTGNPSIVIPGGFLASGTASIGMGIYANPASGMTWRNCVLNSTHGGNSINIVALPNFSWTGAAAADNYLWLDFRFEVQ